MSTGRVHGIGGIFFKARDQAVLAQWYRQHLDFDVQSWGGAQFEWQRTDNGARGQTVWSPFAQDSVYFEPSQHAYMINLRVDDLDGLLQLLRAEGCQVLDRREDSEYGKFGYVLDPEGTLLELWQAPPETPTNTGT